MTEVLSAPHVLEYSYTRSTGPIIGRFLTGLRDGVILGIPGADGRIIVPPQEYDPQTSADLDLEAMTEVGPGGVVTTWTWQETPLAGQPYDRPFAWALVLLDGADTPILHAVDAGHKDNMSTGMRVTAAWAGERTGSIHDLGFVPEHHPEHEPDAATPGRCHTGGLDEHGVLQTPIRLEYTYTPGTTGSQFLHAIREGRIVGRRCPDCSKVYVPPGGACPMCGTALGDEVEVADIGTVATFAIINVSAAPIPLPYVSAEVLFDGADITTAFLLKGVKPEDARMGMRVQAAWKDEADRDFTLANIQWVEPLDEPDADFETYQEHV